VVENFKSAARQGAASFGDAGVFVEKYVQVRQGAAWC
jgi:acetyl/propionyl-CoA carboxylase alpha subunit